MSYQDTARTLAAMFYASDDGARRCIYSAPNVAHPWYEALSDMIEEACRTLDTDDAYAMTEECLDALADASDDDPYDVTPPDAEIYCHPLYQWAARNPDHLDDQLATGNQWRSLFELAQAAQAEAYGAVMMTVLAHFPDEEEEEEED